MNIFDLILNQPITNVLFFFFNILQGLGIPFAFGFSIILLTVSIRLILLPFTGAQIKMSKKMQEMAPHISAMKEKHKEDKKRQQEELLKLYQEFGVNPLAGCLPLLIQLPVFFSLYHVLGGVVTHVTKESIVKINNLLYFDWMKVEKAWDPNFFGISLGAIPAKEIEKMPFLILVPIVTGVLQLILTKMMAPATSPKKEKNKEDDFQTAFAKQSLFIFPIMIGFFSYSLPFGLSIYWNVFTIFGILQQYFQAGPGGLKQWIAKYNSYRNGKTK